MIDRRPLADDLLDLGELERLYFTWLNGLILWLCMTIHNVLICKLTSPKERLHIVLFESPMPQLWWFHTISIGLPVRVPVTFQINIIPLKWWSLKLSLALALLLIMWYWVSVIEVAGFEFKEVHCTWPLKSFKKYHRWKPGTGGELYSTHLLGIAKRESCEKGSWI